MEEFDIEEIKKEMENILLNDIYEGDYKDYKIGYILVNKEKTYGVAFDDSDVAVSIDMEKKEVGKLYDWAYLISEDVFEALEDKMHIGYMNVLSHVAIWQQIGEWYPEDIMHKKGMQKYLRYCKEKGITREFILKEFKTSRLPDAMKYYKECKQKVKDAR